MYSYKDEEDEEEACSMFDKTTGSILRQGKSANKPLWYGFWLWLPILVTNLLFLRIKAFWGGQIC